jgi:hypothetical protein
VIEEPAYLRDLVFLHGRACANTAEEIWFPSTGGRYGPARMICGRCPVIERCERYYLDDESNGFVAGMTLAERHIRRKALRKEAS